MVLDLKHVGLAYDGTREVLRDVDFVLDKGSFVFLTGASGSGKSSLLRLLFAALKPTRGHLRIFDQDVSELSASDLPKLRRRIGVVFQDFRLIDHLTVFENVALPLRVQGQSPTTYRQNVNDLLDWVGLAAQAQAYPAVLSGGEKQRAAIARAVISKPELLLADEPTGNVDPALARRLLHLFAELNRMGTTVLLATHDMALLSTIKAPVLHLQDGIVSEMAKAA